MMEPGGSWASAGPTNIAKGNARSWAMREIFNETMGLLFSWA